MGFLAQFVVTVVSRGVYPVTENVCSPHTIPFSAVFFLPLASLAIFFIFLFFPNFFLPILLFLFLSVSFRYLLFKMNVY